MDRGEEMSVGDILSIYERNKAFYEPHGGITATGGEPLMQLGFLTSLREWHTHRSRYIRLAIQEGDGCRL